MEREQIENLFNKYLSDQCSPAELQMLADYFHTDEHSGLLRELILQELQSPSTLHEDDPAAKEKLDKIFGDIRKKMNGEDTA